MNEHFKLAQKVAEQFVQRQKKKALHVVVDGFKLGDMVVYDPSEDSDAIARVRVFVTMKVVPEESSEAVTLKDQAFMLTYAGQDFEIPESELLRLCFGVMDGLYKKFGYFDFKEFKKAVANGLDSWLITAHAHIAGEIEKEVVKLYPSKGAPQVKAAIDNEFNQAGFRAGVIASSFDPQWVKNHFVEAGVDLDLRAVRYIDARLAMMREECLQPASH